jgi:phosphonate transport system substrate-binding protein
LASLSLSCLFCLCWLMAVVPQQAEAGALRIGVQPYLSPRSLLLEFAPLRQFLSEKIGQPVEIRSARDLPAFIARTHGGDFDLVLTAPHFARLAQTEHGFVPLMAIRADFYALLLVPKHAAADQMAALRHKKLHLPHRLSFVSFQIEDFLRQRGLDPEHDLQLSYYSTDNNAILAAEQSRDDAGATQRTVFESMPHAITDHLRVLGSTQSALSLIIMARPGLPESQVRAIRSALQQFPYSAPGLAFLQASHSEFVPTDAATMAKLDSYLPRLKTRLESHP